MNSRSSHLIHALSPFAMGMALVLAGPMNALATDPIDLATQPHLKSWSNIIPNALSVLWFHGRCFSIEAL